MISPRFQKATLASGLGTEGTNRKSTAVIQVSSGVSFDQDSSHGAEEKWLEGRFCVYFESRAEKIS